MGDAVVLIFGKYSLAAHSQAQPQRVDPFIRAHMVGGGKGRVVSKSYILSLTV